MEAPCGHLVSGDGPEVCIDILVPGGPQPAYLKCYPRVGLDHVLLCVPCADELADGRRRGRSGCARTACGTRWTATSWACGWRTWSSGARIAHLEGFRPRHHSRATGRLVELRADELAVWSYPPP